MVSISDLIEELREIAIYETGSDSSEQEDSDYIEIEGDFVF
jgi:hypothetical protein|tara:strand:- start:375 stop:497 length:123 start_codon:yes stop_codon:yes gene_type:complete